MISMKIAIISDGKFGDRAIDTIKQKFPLASMILVEPRDPKEIIDEYEFPAGAKENLIESDLIISYVCHPDINLEIAKFEKPYIIAIDFGQGLLQQAKEINASIIMPSTMCHLEPNTGIAVIDEFARSFGLPKYELALDSSGMRILTVTARIESPCGATNRCLSTLVNAPITPETINAFAIHIAQECRESVAYMMAKSDGTERATANHVMPLLSTLKQLNPALFEPGGVLHDYFTEIALKFEKQGSTDIVKKILRR